MWWRERTRACIQIPFFKIEDNAPRVLAEGQTNVVKVKIKLINWVKSSVVPVGESDFGARSPLISFCVIYQLVAGFKA